MFSHLFGVEFKYTCKETCGGHNSDASTPGVTSARSSRRMLTSYFNTKVTSFSPCSQISGIFLTNHITWVGCQGSRPELRGYTCSLWQLFHTLTVEAGARPEALDGTGTRCPHVGPGHAEPTCHLCRAGAFQCREQQYVRGHVPGRGGVRAKERGGERLACAGAGSSGTHKPVRG